MLLFILHALVLPSGHLIHTKAFIYYEGFMAQPEMEGNATWYLEITLQLPSHATTLETVSRFVAPFAEKKFHLSQTFQVMLSFSASSRMQLHFPHSWVTAENWGPWSVLLGKEEVRSEESWEIFLWRSLQRLRCFPEVQDKLTEVTGNVQQRKKINPFISSWSCCVSVLERCWPCLFLYSRQWARGLMQSSVGIDRDLWCDQYT